MRVVAVGGCARRELTLVRCGDGQNHRIQEIENLRKLEPDLWCLASSSVPPHSPLARAERGEADLSAVDLGAVALALALSSAPAPPRILLGDSATHERTCPSFAAQVACRAAFPCTPFDAMGLGGALSLHLYLLRSWRDSYLHQGSAVAVSADAMSRHVAHERHSSDGSEVFDGAAATLVSSDPGLAGWEVLAVSYHHDEELASAVRLPMHGHLQVKIDTYQRWMSRYWDNEIEQALESAGCQNLPFALVSPFPVSLVWNRSRCILQLTLDLLLVSGGCSAGLALAAAWPVLGRDHPVVLIAAGLGGNFGITVCRWCEGWR